MLFFNANFICYYFYPTKSVKNQEKAHDGMNKYFVMGFFVVEKT